MQPVLHLHQLLDLAFDQAADRDAGPAGDDLGDVLGVDLLLQQSPVLCRRFLLLRLAQLLLELHQRAVLQLGGAVQVVGAAGLLDLDLGLVDLLAQVGDVLERLALPLPAGAQARRASP